MDEVNFFLSLCQPPSPHTRLHVHRALVQSGHSSWNEFNMAIFSLRLIWLTLLWGVKMGRGAWQMAMVYRVTKSRTKLKWVSMHAWGVNKAKKQKQKQKHFSERIGKPLGNRMIRLDSFLLIQSCKGNDFPLINYHILGELFALYFLLAFSC